MINRTAAVLGFLAAAWPAAVQREERRRQSLTAPGTHIARRLVGGEVQSERAWSGADGPGSIGSDDPVLSRHGRQAPQGPRPVRSTPPPGGAAGALPETDRGRDDGPAGALQAGAGQPLSVSPPALSAVADAPHDRAEAQPAAVTAPLLQPEPSPAGGAPAPALPAPHETEMRGAAPLDTADVRSLRLSAPRLGEPGRQPAMHPLTREPHGAPVSAGPGQFSLAQSSRYRPAVNLPLLHTTAATGVFPAQAHATARLMVRAADRLARRQTLLAAAPSPAGASLAAPPVASIVPGERHALRSPQETRPRPALAHDPWGDVPGPARSEIDTAAWHQGGHSALGSGIGAPAQASDREAAGPTGYRPVDEAELRRMLARIIQTDALRHGLDLKER